MVFETPWTFFWRFVTEVCMRIFVTLQIVKKLAEDIKDFLLQNGFHCEILLRMGQEVLLVHCGEGDSPEVRCVVPLTVGAASCEDAHGQAVRLQELLETLESEGIEPIVITEDRWRRQENMMKARLLAHLEVFTSLFARHCQVRKIDKETAAPFLAYNHSYGDAACRYRYGLYLRRQSRDGSLEADTLVAVATFSNARKWLKGEKTIRSYEWTRYASLPGVRISGGMGKMLKAFVKDVQPDDIMSYADLEWSEGKVYEQLGFVLEGRKEPVIFMVDGQWGRVPLKPGMTGGRFFMNQGSNKYRLKLTEYE